jgi:hypothetical protein
LKRVRSFASTASKLVPVSVTEPPGSPVAGVNPVIVGPRLVATTKGDGLDADPAGVVTPTSPVVAPLGTVTINCVAVALDTVADVPLNETAFWLGVAENPLPRSVTVAPIPPLDGATEITAICDDV